MRFFRNRHLLACSVLFIILTGVLARLPRPALAVCLCAACVLFAAFFVLLIVKRTCYFLMLCALSIACLASCVLSFFYFGVYRASVERRVGEESEVNIFIEDDVSHTGYSSSYNVVIDDGKERFRATLECSYPSYFRRSEIYSGKVKFAPFDKYINDYPELTHKASLGIFICALSEEDNLKYTGSRANLRTLSLSLRDRLSEVFDRALDTEQAGLVKALLLADRGTLNKRIKRNFTALGLSHMLAVSGMHLSILTGFFYVLLRCLRMGKRSRIILTDIFIFAYMLVAGFPASLVRAGATAVAVSLGFFIGKRPDVLTCLCAACSVVCLVNPVSVYDVGFILSVSATFGITLIAEINESFLRRSRLRGPLKYIYTFLLVSAAALSFTLPCSVLSFSEFTAASLFTGFIFTPAVTAILFFAVMLLILSPLTHFAAAAGLLLNTVTGAAIFLSDRLAAFFPAGMSTSYPFIIISVLLFCILLAVIIVKAPKNPAFYALPLALFVFLTSICAPISDRRIADSLTVCEKNGADFLTLGSSDKSICIDISPSSGVSRAYAEYVNAHDRYASRYSAYIIANLYNKTPKYIESLTETKFIKKLYIPSGLEQTTLTLLRGSAEKCGTQIVEYEYGGQINEDGICIKINEPLYLKRSTRPVHRIEVGGSNALFCYLGAAYSETGAPVPDFPLIVCGSYGPKYKQEFDIAALIPSSAAEYNLSENASVYSGSTNVILNIEKERDR